MPKSVSRSRVDKAGRAAHDRQSLVISGDDILVIEEFRIAHFKPLTKVHSSLREALPEIDKDAWTGERPKHLVQQEKELFDEIRSKLEK